MIESRASQFGVNPFSTRRIRPGAIEYRFAAGKAPEEIVAQFVRAGYRGQIVGQHGSGKSTLLHSLRSALAEIAPLHWVQVQPTGQHRFWQRPSIQCGRIVDQGNSHKGIASIIVIDGFDSLGWLARAAIRNYCWRHKIGFIVTTHCDLKLPTLYETRPSLLAFDLVVRELLQGFPTKITKEEIQAAYQACQPDLREALFCLYDLYEQRRRDESPEVMAG